ncbi:MAG: FeoB-associated Cys-rich membrane protein [Deltaproteobacteria bacterium]|nr:FeoB-associated Cys-rich membrane protein [Deltaproteobacteria bacterium]
METLIVILIVGAAAVYCVKSFIKKYKGEDNCNCGCKCESCGTSCDALKKYSNKI